MIQLTPDGMTGSLSAGEAAELRETFARRHCLKLEGLLSAAALARLRRMIDEVPFVHRIHDTIGTEFCLSDGRAVRLMFFLVNDPALFDIVRQLTGCARIGCFTGRIYRMIPGSDDYDTWHSDVIQDRMIGMSVNLGDAYEGGVFQLRDRGGGALICEAPNVVPGDAILFRIDRRLEHWITPMAGAAPKTAFAGWFRSAPEFMSLMDREGEEPIPEPEWQ